MVPRSDASVIGFEFSRFKLVPGRRQFLVDGRPADVGDRAIDVLTVLLRAGGEVVSKEHLIQTVWMGRVVEDNALQAQVSALRRAFGAERDLIKTVAGRGYQFTGQLTASRSAERPAREYTNLTLNLVELVGREVQVAEVLGLLGPKRLLTLIGTGGIGKTQLALEVGRQAMSRFRDGVWMAQLAPFSDPDLVPSALSSALGLPHLGGAPALGRALRAKNALIVLDSCEHVIGAATALAERILQSAAGVSVIATSREPLRADGEYVYPVPSLSFPEASDSEPKDPMQWGSINLFVTRARDSAPHFRLDSDVAAKIAHICRRLDGIPLAVELAASRIAALGIDELSARLDDQLTLLSTGKRTALPHQQTLQATLDWSHDLLADPERVILRRLAVFNGVFSLQAAAAVAADSEFPGATVAMTVADLVAKSLVSPGIAEFHGGYRLLETTRAYALERLQASAERARFSRRHAEHYHRLFEQADMEWISDSHESWLARYRPCIDNVRAALDWAFSPEGEPVIGIGLTVAALPLWLQLSLIDECLWRVERALGAIQAGTAAGEHNRMKLHSALGWSLMYTTGRARETGEAWSEALAIAERLDDTDYRLRSLWGLWAGHVNNGKFQGALDLAERFQTVAKQSTEPADTLVGERMVGAALHFLGDQTRSREHVEHMLAHYVAPSRRSHTVRYQFDQRITARITLARVLWLQGCPDKAMSVVGETVADALSLNHSLSIGNTLAQAACPLALLTGDLDAAERYIGMLVNHTRGGALDVWHSYGRCFTGMLLIRQQETDEGIPLLQTGIDELRDARFSQYKTAFLSSLADGLRSVGRGIEGLAAIEEALQQADSAQERWCLPELLRLRGELQRARGLPSAAIEEQFSRSTEWAIRQGALSWQLRTATSLARLRIDEGRQDEAHAILSAVRDRFTEGFETSDLKAADALLGRRRTPGPRVP